MRRRLLLVLLLLLPALLPAPGCGAEPGSPSETAVPRRLVVTEVPGETPTAPDRPGDSPPRRRYPPGSRLVLRDPTGERAPVVLSEGLIAAGGAAPSFDGEILLFTGLEREGERYAVFEVRPDGGGRRKVVDRETDAFDPAWLPDGRIVFTGTLTTAGPRGPATALFVSRREGTGAERITFGTGGAREPCVLPDGRVAYVSWQPEPEGTGLMAVHPDGTGAWRIAGMGPEEGIVAAPRSAPGGDLAFVARGPRGASRAVVRPRASPRERVLLPVPGEATAVEPAGKEAWLVSAGAAAARTGGVYLCRGGERRRILAAGRGVRITHAVFLEARPKPQGHLSIVDRATVFGTLLALDARAGGRGTRIRLIALDGPFVAGIRPAGRTLGEVRLDAGDGSFFVRVPADAPLLLDLLDDDGRVLRAGRTPFWVRPNEVRTCVGCHHDGMQAPANRRPRAVLLDPVSLTGEAEGGA